MEPAEHVYRIHGREADHERPGKVDAAEGYRHRALRAGESILGSHGRER